MIRKRRVIYKFITFYFASLICLCSCKASWEKLERKKIDIGIVTTTQSNYRSEILWLDKELKNEQKQKLYYAGLGDTLDTVPDCKDSLFLVPQGIMKVKNSTQVISVDKNSLEIKKYAFSHKGVFSSAALGRYVFSLARDGRGCVIERFNRTNGKKKTLSLKNDDVYPIIAAGDKLYVFSRRDYSETYDVEYKYTLKIYSEDMNLIKSIDISEFGGANGKFCEDDSFLYVSISEDKNEKNIGKILRIDKNTLEIEEIETSQNNPSDIFICDENLIVVYANSDGEKSKIGIISNSGSERLYRLDIFADVAGIKGDIIYMANGMEISGYSLKGGMKKVYNKQIQIQDGHYVTALLVVN